VRAFNPWPSAYCFIGGKRLQIHRAGDRPATLEQPPGTVVEVGDTIAIATGDGLLLAHELQVEGRKRLAAAELARSGALKVGSQLD
jgi:methionyl-tRNA formyltransferase